jgi:hypothetical protein
VAEHRCQKMILRFFPIGLEVAVVKAVVERDGRRPVRASQIHAGWLKTKKELFSIGKFGRIIGCQLGFLYGLR